MKADKLDRNEPVLRLEPLRISEGSRHRGELMELVLELTAHASALRGGIQPGLLEPLANLVRNMNCYYSNLIEGHNTHPIDIEQALNGEYSGDSEKRNLQLEAKAHIEVQSWLDTASSEAPITAESQLIAIHRRFCEQLPSDLLTVKDEERVRIAQVVPGKYRNTDVRVGHHIAISPGAVPRFMRRFEEAYSDLGRAETLLSAAAAHHRLLWIHPFVDGNGRVARLMSHTMLTRALDSGGLWSIARGFARNVQDYKAHLANCDLPRRNDLDGRGHLSEEALCEFSVFFLENCIDQIQFMERLMAPKTLLERIRTWAEKEVQSGRLNRSTTTLIDALLFQGELARHEIPGILNLGERSARRTVASAMNAKIISSDSTRAPIRLAFPARVAPEWFPNLFPND